jgi:hypothetical protein
MQNFKYKSVLLIVLVIILVCFDFYQNYINQMDGDLSRIMTEVSEFRLDDFRVHGILLPYFFFVNKLFWIVFDAVAYVTNDPVDSIYLTMALIKSVYVPILFLTIINLMKYFYNICLVKLDSRLIILCIILIYNQNFGFNRTVGVVNHSFIYYCSYALPILVMLYFVSVYLLKNSFLSLSLVFVIGLFGNLNPIIPLGLFVSVVILSLVKGKFFLGIFREHKAFFVISLLLVLIKAYSARYLEIENINGGKIMTIAERYVVMFSVGLRKYFGQQVFFILLGYLVIQFVLRFLGHFKYYISDLKEGSKLLLIFWFGYILVLPVFGYKPYRPEIIKADIMTPCLMLLHIFIIVVVITGFRQRISDFRGLVINVVSVLLIVIFGYKDRVIVNPTMQREKYLLDLISIESYSEAGKKSCISITEPIMFWKGMEKDQGLINRNNIFLRRCGVLKDCHSYCVE